MLLRSIFAVFVNFLEKLAESNWHFFEARDSPKVRQCPFRKAKTNFRDIL